MKLLSGNHMRLEASLVEREVWYKLFVFGISRLFLGSL